MTQKSVFRFSSSASNFRMNRIGDQIQRELSQLLLTKVNDPRLHQIFITDVQVSPDMAQATVFVTLAEGKPWSDALAALEHASGFLRRELAHALNLRITPRLKFTYDKSTQQANRLSRLIHDVAPPEEPNE